MKYKVIGMTCASCARAIESKVSKLEGVREASINLVKEELSIDYESKKINYEQIKKAIKSIGYDITFREEKKNDNNDKLKLIIAITFAVLVLYSSLNNMLMFIRVPMPSIIDASLHPLNYAIIQLLLTIPVIISCYRIYISGTKALIHRLPNMDSLITIGTGSAFIYSLISTVNIYFGSINSVDNLYYESASVVLALVTLGKYLENSSKKRTNEAINKLIKLVPNTATIIRNNIESEIDINEVVVGDVCIVRPGSRIPLDGEVISGDSYVDESHITGESMPVAKGRGSKVIGGSINGNGVLKFKVKAVGEDSTISKIVKLVEEASSKKAPIAKLADTISGYFVPVVIWIAIVAAVIWLLVGKDFSFALTIFISVLVIACPCALGLATPVAIITGTGKGAEKGILIKSGLALELMNKAKVVILDKTGTITEGKPTVTDIIAYDKHFDEQNILKYAASLEHNSEHPLAIAIMMKAEKIKGTLFEVVDFMAMPGYGIKATANQREVTIGNMKLMNNNNIDVTISKPDVDQLSNKGKIILYIAIGKKLVGLIAVADTIKETSLSAVKNLKQLGMDVIMLTGDNHQTAQAIGSMVNIDRVVAEVLPQDKYDEVRKIQSEGKKVIMVGDGINDAPALVQADIGVAIGTGTDIAVESADVILMRGDLNDVASSIKLSNYTIRNIKQNLFWAFIYNVVGIPIAAGLLYALGGPLLNPMLAGAAMAFSSVSVVLNALKLKRRDLSFKK